MKISEESLSDSTLWIIEFSSSYPRIGTKSKHSIPSKSLVLSESSVKLNNKLASTELLFIIVTNQI